MLCAARLAEHDKTSARLTKLQPALSDEASRGFRPAVSFLQSTLNISSLNLSKAALHHARHAACFVRGRQGVFFGQKIQGTEGR
jgi:hypothetical protein